jgi:pilus assembly protein CpaB
MSKRVLVVLGIGLVGAVAATFLFYQLMAGRLSTPNETVSAPSSVVIAARELPRGRRLALGDVRVEPWNEGTPGSGPPPDAFLDPREALGRVIQRPIAAGNLITQADLLVEDESWLAARIPEGMRGVSVHVGEFAGITQLIRVGDRVDVMVADQERMPGRPNVRLRTLLENIEVIATGREPLPDGRLNPLPVVTLLVGNKDSEAVYRADQGGVIRLALRSPLEGIEAPAASALSGTPQAGGGAAEAAATSPENDETAAKTDDGVALLKQAR